MCIRDRHWSEDQKAHFWHFAAANHSTWIRPPPLAQPAGPPPEQPAPPGPQAAGAAGVISHLPEGSLLN
eukprot:8209851-Alexandrium_andersonii.AAC.1